MSGVKLIKETRFCDVTFIVWRSGLLVAHLVKNLFYLSFCSSCSLAS